MFRKIFRHATGSGAASGKPPPGQPVDALSWITTGAAVVMTAALTLLAGWAGYWRAESRVTAGTTIGILLLAHAFVLFCPLEAARRAFRRCRDVFDPEFVSYASFAIFHVLLNPIILSSPVELNMFALDRLSEQELALAVFGAYAVTLVAWIGFWLGVKWVLRRKSRPIHYAAFVRGSPDMLLGMGLLFVAVGILGNVMAIGGWQQYLLKMSEFFARWETYEEIMLASGSTKWNIAMRFLPAGLLLLAYAHAIRRKLFTRHLVRDLVVVSLLNALLNCATGQRSATLMALMYSIVIVNHQVIRLRIRTLVIISGVFIVLAVALGTLRNAFYFGNRDFGTILVDYIPNTARRFSVAYLTNFAGTLALVSEVFESGTVQGATAFSGVTGLLGGPTPVNTQMEMWYRITGQYLTGNPRYGPPGELFFNFGWAGVVFGMTLIGLCVGLLTRLYRGRHRYPTASAGFLAVYCVLTAEFIVIANLSYIPPHFTYFSAPFFMVFLVEYLTVPKVRRWVASA